jgi:micrococcal nuclease
VGSLALLVGGLVLVAGLLLLRERASVPTAPPSAQVQPRNAPGAQPPATALVTRISDGDTVHVEGNWVIRYLGIDTPELARDGQPAQPLAVEASDRNRALAFGKLAELERDREERDRYGRLLRHVWVDGQLVAVTLISEGLGRVYTAGLYQKHRAELRAAEAVARAAGRGIWSGMPSFGPSSAAPPLAVLRGSFSAGTEGSRSGTG